MRTPEAFSKQIAIFSLGTAPQIITEGLYALTQGRLKQGERPFLPTKIVVISTETGISKAKEAMAEHYVALQDEYPDLPLPSLENIHYQCIEKSSQPLLDIRTPQDNEAAANTIARVIRHYASEPDSALHISIAGGRKTQGYYTGFAASLYGRPQDRLSHVLVDSQYEGLPTFYFPTRQSNLITGREGELLDTSLAQVELAELPFVCMRKQLGNSEKFIMNPALEISQIAKRIEQANTEVDLQVRVGPGKAVMQSLDVTVDITGQPLILAYLLLFYLDRRDNPNELGIELPTKTTPLRHLGETFVEALCQVTSVIHDQPWQQRTANAQYEFLLGKVNERALSTLFEDAQLPTVNAMPHGFMSERRKELKELWQGQLPDVWLSKLLPAKQLGGHVINLGSFEFHGLQLG